MRIDSRETHSLSELLGATPVVPVLVVERARDALDLAAALVSGGLCVLEITLRTDAALTAVREIAESIPEAILGVGSVIEPAQFAAAAKAGARFAVSPGATAQLQAAAEAAKLPWLPGAQTLSEMLNLRTSGHRLIKFFPAEASGGVEFLRSIAGPLPDVRFCPTGGISYANAPNYLALSNVSCVGGSWIAPPTLIGERRWDEISALARAARALRQSARETS